MKWRLGNIQLPLELSKYTHNTNKRRGNEPAEFPPDHGVVAYHLLDAIVEAVNPVRPGDGDTLEEDEEQQTETAHSVRIQYLEHVHTALYNTTISN